jgi:ribosomal protein S14
MFCYSLTPFNSSKSRLRNRCVRSGRQYNVLRKTQTCRFVFRFESYEGLLPGVSRSS